MMITRNTKTRKEEAAAAKKKKNRTAYFYFHKFSQFFTMKSLFRFTFVSKLWYNTNNDYLPRLSDDIILFHILTQLPAKSLRRFSCVSKLWYNTIHHDPIFIDSHYNHSKSKPSLVLITAGASETHFKYLDQGEQEEGASFTLIVNSQRNWKNLVGSVNGLTCFRTSFLIEICNPSTHEILGIPYPPKWKMLDPCRCGFGFDPLVNQYKILRVTVSDCQVCTLGAGMHMSDINTQDCIWRDITVISNLPLHECEMKLGEPPYIFASGALCRVISSNRIILFDIHYEKFQVIPGLKISYQNFHLYTMCEFRGCPCAVYYVNITNGYQFSLCALKKQQSNGNSNVGSIPFVFEQSFRFPYKTLKNSNLQLSFTEYSGQILLQWFDITNEMHFYVYNPHTKRLQKDVSGSSPVCFDALFVKHIDNLFSLKKLVPLSPPGAPVTGIKYLSSRETTMHDEESPTTLSLKNRFCCLGSSTNKHQQDMNLCDHMSRFKPIKIVVRS